MTNNMIKKVANKKNLLTTLIMILFMSFAVSCANKSGDGGDTNTGGTSGTSDTGTEGIVDVSTIDSDKSNELQKISFLQESVGIVKGNTRELKLLFNPSSATNKSVTWQSSDDAIASVANGTVTGKATGTAYITATSAANSDISATATVKVVATATNATAIEIGEITSSGHRQLYSNESYTQSSKQLAVKLTPEDATDEITWKSSDATIASITADGLVKFLKEGDVTITAASKTNNSITKTQDFTVKQIEATEITVAKNLRFWLLSYENNIELSGKLTYNSSDSSVVSVHTDSGMFTALETGTANITMEDPQGNTFIYKVTVKDIPLVKVSGTVSGNLPANPIVYMNAVLGGYPFYSLAEIKNNQYSFWVPKDSKYVQGGISQTKGNNLNDYEFFSAWESIRKATAATVMPELQAYNIYKMKLNFVAQNYKQRIYAQVVSSYLSTKNDELAGETEILKGRTSSTIKIKTIKPATAKLKIWLFKDDGKSEPSWTPNTYGGSTPAVGDATAVYFKEVALNTTTVSLTSSDELKWSKINITGQGAAAQNDSVSIEQALQKQSDSFSWSNQMGSCTLDASKQCSLMVLPGSYKMGLQTNSYGSGVTMPKLSMPIKNKTDLTYFNSLTPVVIGNGTTVNKDFSLTQMQGVTLTATIQTPKNMDGKWFGIDVYGLTPRVEAKLTDTANYASNKLKSGVKQNDGSYRYKIEATLPKADLDAEIFLEAGSYNKEVTKNLNANLKLGVVELELDK